MNHVTQLTHTLPLIGYQISFSHYCWRYIVAVDVKVGKGNLNLDI